MKPKAYRLPQINYFTLYADMSEQTHLLIAGQTGSGKSTVINGIVYSLLRNSPQSVSFIFIDPKQTELIAYKNLPHTITYASRNDDIVEALRDARDIMNVRLEDMSEHGWKEYDGDDVYVIIDELAQITLTLKSQAVPILQELLQLGRAAKVHVIAASQNPLATVIPTVLKVNFTGIVALKTLTKQHSRNIIDIPGCETFPIPKLAGTAYGYYLDGCQLKLYRLPMHTEKEITDIVNYWTDKSRYLVC